MILTVVKIREICAQASEVVVFEVFFNHSDSMICLFVLYGNTSHEYKTLSAVPAQAEHGQKMDILLLVHSLLWKCPRPGGMEL